MSSKSSKPMAIPTRRLFDGKVDCYFLDDGRRVVSDVYGPTLDDDDADAAWRAAFARVACTDLVEAQTCLGVVRCVEARHLMEQLSLLRLECAPDTAVHRGAEQIRRLRLRRGIPILLWGTLQ